MAPLKKLTVYPAPRSLEILGATAPALNQAIDCWAELMAQASADNAETFRREEWNYLADLLNGTLHEPGFGTPGTIYAMEAADGHRLDRLGDKWFGDNGDAEVSDLVLKLERLDYAHCWAMLSAVQFFWTDLEIDHQTDEWWTLSFRRARRRTVEE